MRDLAAQADDPARIFGASRADILDAPAAELMAHVVADAPGCTRPSSRLVAAFGLAAKGVRCAGGTVE